MWGECHFGFLVRPCNMYLCTMDATWSKSQLKFELTTTVTAKFGTTSWKNLYGYQKISSLLSSTVRNPAHVFLIMTSFSIQHDCLPPFELLRLDVPVMTAPESALEDLLAEAKVMSEKSKIIRWLRIETPKSICFLSSSSLAWQWNVYFFNRKHRFQEFIFNG